MTVRAIPEGQRTLTAHLSFADCAKAIDFYKAAFGAEEHRRMPGPSGKIMHAELRFGDSQLYVSDHFGPPQGAPSGTVLTLWSTDVDTLWARAVKAGATVKMPIDNQFWGDRYGQLSDPYGYTWALMQHVEDVTPEETVKRSAEAMKKQMGNG